MKKMTPWFLSRIKPVHKGVYETKWSCIDEWVYGFSYWNGSKWSNSVDTEKAAYKLKEWNQHAEQQKHWRGFTEKQT